LGIIYGLIDRKREPGYIPFVPFIYGGSMIAYFYGNTIVQYYNEFLQLFI